MAARWTPNLAMGVGMCLHLLAASSAAAGGLSPAGSVVPLSNGPNVVTLTAAALPAQAFLAHRDNANAHGFDVLTLYIQAPTGPGSPPQWQLVPALDARDERRRSLPNGEHLTLTVSGGADCRLHDFRLLAPAHGSNARLILADRELGDSFASAAPVTFRFFKLAKNGDGLPGRPVYYFEFDHEQRAARPYCDVGKALRAELALGPYQPATP